MKKLAAIRAAALGVGILAITVFMANKSYVDAVEAAPVGPNPLLAKWDGPYGGVLPFDKVKIADFSPALQQAMADNLIEIDTIANDPSAPTFANTFVPLEESGDELNRVQTLFGVWSSSLNTPEFQPIQAEMQPKLAAHYDKITQNAKLFKRIEAVYRSPETKKLTPEQQRLVKVYYDNFVHSGAALDPVKKARLSELNQQLAVLYTKFNQNLQGEEGELFVQIDTEAGLSGLPQSLKDAAAEAAKAKGKAGWIIRNTRSSTDPFLTYADDRRLREKVWKMFVSRGDNGDSRDNNSTITQILKLRTERAHLFGLPSHAHWIVGEKMAKDPAAAMKLMESIWPAAIGRVREEVADMQALADKEKAGIKIAPWDYHYYMEKVRKDKYDLDQNEIKPYLQLDKMREAMFWVAGKLFNFNFAEVKGVPVFNPDMVVYEVQDMTSGKHIGLWYFDPYARDGKDSGAWMNQYRSQSRIGGKEIATIVSNNANFVKGKPGEPVLISWDDATTMFHEFGHALHGLSSNVTYPLLSGTNVATDYVEFPSQLLEHWVTTPEVLNKFALHYQTGKPMPQSLVEKIKKAATFNSGFDTTELLASALMDMKIHMAGDTVIDPKKFEREELAKLGMPSEIVMRHRLPQFRHIFASDDYSAGYYSYLWSDVLKADAFTAFTEAGGPYDPKVAARLKQYVFSVGNTIDPAEGFRKFRGRDPKVDALFAERGFPMAH
jgi:peptidyl-dipeptidase Dcp